MNHSQIKLQDKNFRVVPLDNHQKQALETVFDFREKNWDTANLHKPVKKVQDSKRFEYI